MPEGKMEENRGSRPVLEQVLPEKIEERSFAMISHELEQMGIWLKPDEEMVVKRVIHTTADFDYASSLVFSPGAVSAGIRALKAGAVVITDTNMARAGINKNRLQALGGQVYCFMADEDVAEDAKQKNSTRAAASMEKAARLFGEPGELKEQQAGRKPLVLAVGNAPTALVKLWELLEAGRLKPALIIGVPVGFVNVVQAKELLIGRTDVPYIVARGRKGGSNVAAAIVNALLYKIARPV